MKKEVLYILALLIIALSLMLVKLNKECEKYRYLYDKERSNVEAYRASNSSLGNKILEYKMSMDDLRNSLDSIDNKLVKVVDSLKVKDKNVQSVQYIESIITKTDSIILNDTIFKEEVHLDTLLKDNWYSMKLNLDYPSNIVISPKFRSEKYVIINTKKEYNKKPSKIFFIRWFQKKHLVTEVEVEEKNPYIENGKSKFIKIIK